MLQVTKTGANRVDLHLTGALTAHDMREGLEALVTASQDVENGLMLYTIDDFQWPEASALAVEFTMMPKLFGMIGKFRRCAVIADANWLRTVAEIEGFLMPWLAIKSFTPDDAADAEKWLAQGQDKEPV